MKNNIFLILCKVMKKQNSVHKKAKLPDFESSTPSSIKLWGIWELSALPECVLNGTCTEAERLTDTTTCDDITFKQIWWKCDECKHDFEENLHTATEHELICPNCNTNL